VEIARSAVLPDLDTGLLARLAYYEDQNAAVLEFRDSLKRA
jgi:hypothetical protein